MATVALPTATTAARLKPYVKSSGRELRTLECLRLLTRNPAIETRKTVYRTSFSTPIGSQVKLSGLLGSTNHV